MASLRATGMAGEHGDRLVERLKGDVGDALRTVTRFGPGTYDVRFVRDDVDEAYPPDIAEEIHREQMFAAMHREYRERLFHAAGRLESTVHRFEHVAILRVLNGESGVFVSFDRDGSLDVEELCDRCRDAVARD